MVAILPFAECDDCGGVVSMEASRATGRVIRTDEELMIARAV
jgi:acetate kinase